MWDKKKIPFYEHLFELKIRLYFILINFIVLFIIFYNYSYELLFLLAKPLININLNYKDFIFTHIFDVFLINFKLAFILSIFFNFPYFLYQFFVMFIIQFLNIKLLKIFYNYFFFWKLLLIISFILIYIIYLPIFYYYFLNFEINYDYSLINIKLESKIDEYILLILNLYKYIYIFFLLFLFSFIFLIYFKKYELIIFKKYNYIFYIIIIIFNLIFSSPEILSQIFLICISLLIFEINRFLFIYYMITINNNKKKG